MGVAAGVVWGLQVWEGVECGFIYRWRRYSVRFVLSRLYMVQRRYATAGKALETLFVGSLLLSDWWGWLGATRTSLSRDVHTLSHI